MGPLFWLRAGIYTLRGYNYVRERKFRFILAGGLTAGTVSVLAKNDWDVNSIGAVRFARAGLTVSLKLFTAGTVFKADIDFMQLKYLVCIHRS